jgi:hypothetical protein
VGGTGVSVGGTGVLVGGTGVLVGGTGVSVGLSPPPQAETINVKINIAKKSLRFIRISSPFILFSESNFTPYILHLTFYILRFTFSILTSCPPRHVEMTVVFLLRLDLGF